MQVSEGIPEGLISLPMPKLIAHPSEVEEIMKDCWKFDAKQRPTFAQLYERLTSIQPKAVDQEEIVVVPIEDAVYQGMITEESTTQYQRSPTSTTEHYQ